MSWVVIFSPSLVTTNDLIPTSIPIAVSFLISVYLEVLSIVNQYGYKVTTCIRTLYMTSTISPTNDGGITVLMAL
jgi:hypothetical protein